MIHKIFTQKNGILYTGALLVVSLIFSCATTIPTPEKGTGTLVVIPLQNNIEHDFDLHYSYYVQINHIASDTRAQTVRIPDNRNYVVLRSLDPGDYYIAGYRWRTESDSGDLRPLNRDVSPFRVEEGTLTITPIGFGWHKFLNEEGRQSSRFSVLKNKDGILHREILGRVREENPEKIQAWEIPQFSGDAILSRIDAVLADAPPVPFELEFTDILTGSTISMDQLKGKVVVIDFWASWCPPCVAELPHMLELYERYKDQGVEFIGISLDEASSTVESFCREQGITWPQYCEDGKTWDTQFSRDWGISSIPTVFILDTDGKIYSREARGKLDWMIPELLGVQDDRVLGFYNFNGSAANSIERPHASGNLKMRAKLPDDQAESAYEAISNYIDFENNGAQRIHDTALVFNSSIDRDFPPYDYVQRPHISVPNLTSRAFTMGLGFTVSENGRSVPRQTVFMNMTDRKAQGYFAQRRARIDEWWSSLNHGEMSPEERRSARQEYETREQEIFDDLGIQTEERRRITLLQSGFLGRWFNLHLESDTGRTWELVAVLNNIDWRFPVGAQIEPGIANNLFVNFDFASRTIDFWVNGDRTIVDISQVPDQSFCPSGGAENYAMQLFPFGAPSGSQMDYAFLANGNRSYEEISTLFETYFEE